MSTGISISSINRIKELAEQKKFKEALEILDTQNLEKSINPQFLKISGEIFRENKRYYDCRKILLKAHQMSPQGTRIIYELIQLYLELGYFSLAEKYYEQYLFYVTPEDTQKEYVEYMMKKATGADIKELAAILIPILERMPEDRWNFEAILLYDKMDRKDMALDESRYILENFKESEYVQPVIDYIDEKLDIDKCFYVYPKDEQSEDKELFGDLIELEEKILEADHLRMYPPEARIMVEADDHDAIETAPVKEKKPKKTKSLFKKNAKNADDVADGELADVATESAKDEKDAVLAVSAENTDDKTASADEKDTLVVEQASKASEVSKEESAKEATMSEDAKQDDDKSDAKSSLEDNESVTKQSETESTSEIESGDVASEEQVKQEREAALEKILAKKFDKDKLKESAKQVAKTVKEIDKDKAKQQVKSVATTVKDNVKKATDVIGEAVGTKTAEQVVDAVEDKMVPDEELIMDGIIEGVLEPPKKAVGEVIMNEELDAIIPDSLEAMSEKEIADIEAKKEEIERLELEALETTLKLEEEKKAKRQAKLKMGNKEVDDEEDTTEEEAEEQITSEETSEEKQSSVEENSSEDKNDEVPGEQVVDESSDDKDVPIEVSFTSDNSSYTELKNRFMKEMEEDKPLESLGFMTVVHSDVDAAMEEAIPDAAGMLRQMIDNKEYYSGENSLGFESEASYLNHGFEVEDCDFDTYRKQLEEEQEEPVEQDVEVAVPESDVEDSEEETPAVQEIFAQENVVAFEEVAEEPEFIEEPVMVEEPVIVEEPEFIEEPVMVEEPAFVEEPVIVEEPEFIEEPVMVEEPAFLEEPVIVEEPEFIEEPVMVEEPEFIEEPVMVEEPAFIEESVMVEEPEFIEEPIGNDIQEDNTIVETEQDLRAHLRADIILSYRMEIILQELKRK